MDQSFLAFGVSVANEPSADFKTPCCAKFLSNKFGCKIFKNLEEKPFTGVFVRFAKILLILSWRGHFCSQKRSGSEHDNLCRVWESGEFW